MTGATARRAGSEGAWSAAQQARRIRNAWLCGKRERHVEDADSDDGEAALRDEGEEGLSRGRGLGRPAGSHRRRAGGDPPRSRLDDLVLAKGGGAVDGGAGSRWTRSFWSWPWTTTTT